MLEGYDHNFMSVSISRSNNTSQKLFLFDKMTAPNKMTVKKLSEEVDRMKIKLEQMDSLQKRVLELEKLLEIMKQPKETGPKNRVSKDLIKF